MNELTSNIFICIGIFTIASMIFLLGYVTRSNYKESEKQKISIEKRISNLEAKICNG